MKFKCDTCGTKFEAYSEYSKQATGCAASLYKLDGVYYILGHYGSIDYDMQRYALKGKNYKEGEICDKCINTLIKEGNAALIEDGVW
jgi:hypothetical protein